MPVTTVWLSLEKEAWMWEQGAGRRGADSGMLSSTRRLYNVMVRDVALESELSSQPNSAIY